MKKYTLLTVLTVLSFKLFAAGDMPSKEIIAKIEKEQVVELSPKEKIANFVNQIDEQIKEFDELAKKFGEKINLGNINDYGLLTVISTGQYTRFLAKLIQGVHKHLEARLDAKFDGLQKEIDSLKQAVAHVVTTLDSLKTSK